MPDPIAIRGGNADDAERISALIIPLAEEFIIGEFSAQGRETFLRDHTPSKVRERLAGDFRFYLAESGDELAGVAAIRSNKHLYYLFVGRRFQRTGLARRLWVRVKDHSLALGNPGTFTVNASSYAVPAYERLGFQRAAAAQEKDGVRFNPMQFVSLSQG